MNFDRFMRKVTRIDFKNAVISENYTEEDEKYKSLRSSIQKLKPLVLWLQAYEQPSSMGKQFQKVYEKVNSKTRVIEEEGNYFEISKVLTQNEDNLQNVAGFSSLNQTVKIIAERKKIINNKLSLIIHKLEEAMIQCKTIDIERNRLRDVQYKCERAHQKNAEYKFDNDFQSQQTTTLDAMKEFLSHGLENTISELNSTLKEFYNLS